MTQGAASVAERARSLDADGWRRERREEVALVARLVADDAAAWRGFMRDYGPLVKRCVARVLGRFGRSDAEAQEEVFAALSVQLLARDKQKLRAWDPGQGTRLSTWIGMLATNAAWDHLRAARHLPRTVSDIEELRLRCDDPAPDDQCAQRQLATRLTSLLEELSDRDRQLVDELYRLGRSPEETAERMGISVKTVYTKLFKIRARLRGRLEGAGAEAEPERASAGG